MSIVCKYHAVKDFIIGIIIPDSALLLQSSKREKRKELNLRSTHLVRSNESGSPNLNDISITDMGFSIQGRGSVYCTNVTTTYSDLKPFNFKIPFRMLA